MEWLQGLLATTPELTGYGVVGELARIGGAVGVAGAWIWHLRSENNQLREELRDSNEKVFNILEKSTQAIQGTKEVTQQVLNISSTNVEELRNWGEKLVAQGNQLLRICERFADKKARANNDRPDDTSV